MNLTSPFPAGPTHLEARAPARPAHRYFAEARYLKGLLCLALTQRKLAPHFSRFILTETAQHTVWLLAVLDTTKIARMEPYLTEGTRHQISTLLEGRPTFVANSRRLCYAILLAGRPSLPTQVLYPETMPADTLPLGVTLRGPVQGTWQMLRNILVTGAQGTGKSSFLVGAANVALRQGAALLLADPEGHTFNPAQWNALTAQPVAQTTAEMGALLEGVQAEIQRRAALYQAAAQGGRPPENLPAYNRLGAESLARVVLLADEANDYFDDPEVTRLLAEVARHARKWGVNLILAAHSWRAAEVPRKLSGRFPTRLAFRVADNTSARVVLDDPVLGRQAMQLQHPGQGLLRLPGGLTQVLQTYYLAPAQEARWQAALPPQPAMARMAAPEPQLTERERELAQRALAETEGKMTLELLQQWGLGWQAATRLARGWEARGWLAQDPQRGNARYVTETLRQKLKA